MTVLQVIARDVQVGDELLVGPQGRVPEAPTVLAVDVVGDVVVADLIDESSRGEARWSIDSPLVVMRP